MESDIELENERDPDQIKEEEEADDQELVIIPVAVKETCSEYSTKDGCKVIPVRKSNDSKVMCELCCDILKSSASLERHIKRRHGHVAFTCEECATTFVFVERSSQVRATKNTWPYYRYRETAGKLDLVSVSSTSRRLIFHPKNLLSCTVVVPNFSRQFCLV